MCWRKISKKKKENIRKKDLSAALALLELDKPLSLYFEVNIRPFSHFHSTKISK